MPVSNSVKSKLHYLSQNRECFSDYAHPYVQPLIQANVIPKEATHITQASIEINCKTYEAKIYLWNEGIDPDTEYDFGQFPVDISIDSIQEILEKQLLSACYWEYDRRYRQEHRQEYVDTRKKFFKDMNYNELSI